jgi:hypothetical protein
MQCGELPSNSGVLGSYDEARPSGACLACRYCAPRERREGQAPVAPAHPPPLPRTPAPRAPARPPARPGPPQACPPLPPSRRKGNARTQKIRRSDRIWSVCLCLPFWRTSHPSAARQPLEHPLEPHCMLQKIVFREAHALGSALYSALPNLGPPETQFWKATNMLHSPTEKQPARTGRRARRGI